jgi:chromosome segregation ATPase
LFAGSWFDSLESIIVNNVQHDEATWEKLERREGNLKLENCIACERLEYQKTDLTSDHVDMLHHQIKCLEQQTKELESEIANIMEKKKITSQARKSLNLFYPI